MDNDRITIELANIRLYAQRLVLLIDALMREMREEQERANKKNKEPLWISDFTEALGELLDGAMVRTEKASE